MVEPTKRNLTSLWRLLRDAGSRAELNRWLKAYPEPKDQKRKRGRPANVFFTDFSVSEGPAKGLCVVGFRIGGAAPLVRLIVRPQKHRLKPGDARTWVELQCAKKYGQNFQFPTPHEAFREIVQTLGELPEEIDRQTDLTPAERKVWKLEAKKLKGRIGGGTIDSITRRLAKEFRTRIKAQD